MNGPQYLLLLAAGIALIVWGLPAAHRWPGPRNLLPAFAVLLGVAAAMTGLLLTVLPRFFMNRTDMIRAALTLLLAALLTLTLISGAVRWRQQAQFSAAELGALNNNFMVALTGYESAIRMYTPLSSLAERAAERLWAMGLTAEQNGDIERALIAYRSLRSAWYGVRWLSQPGTVWISRCDKKLAALTPLRKGTEP